jgi:hypothetical protein
VKPVRELRPIDPPGSQAQHEMLLLLDGSEINAAVEDEKGLHRGVGETLVAVDEGVVLNQREAGARPPSQ